MHVTAGRIATTFLIMQNRSRNFTKVGLSFIYFFVSNAINF